MLYRDRLTADICTGSFLEFLPALSLLTSGYTPATLPYHVVVPSLPGYTLSSSPPVDKDFTTQDAARLIDRLMIGLGFGSGYIAQGGDIGSKIGRALGAKYSSCKGPAWAFCYIYVDTHTHSLFAIHTHSPAL